MVSSSSSQNRIRTEQRAIEIRQLDVIVVRSNFGGDGSGAVGLSFDLFLSLGFACVEREKKWGIRLELVGKPIEGTISNCSCVLSEFPPDEAEETERSNKSEMDETKSPKSNIIFPSTLPKTNNGILLSHCYRWEKGDS